MLREAASNQARDAIPDLQDPDQWWNPGWIPIFATGGQTQIALDCSDPTQTPLRRVDWPSIGTAHFAYAFAPSLGEFVARAITALRAERYRYDADARTWLPMDWAQVPIGEQF